MSEAAVTRPKTGSIKPGTLRGLHREWHDFSRDHAGPEDVTEREWRILWTNGRLAARGLRTVGSWNDLSEHNALYLLKLLREETGEGPAYRAVLIRKMALALWDEEKWESYLATRVFEKHGINDLLDLSPADAHDVMEELVSRIARKEIAQAGGTDEAEILQRKIREVRGRFSRRGTEAQR